MRTTLLLFDIDGTLLDSGGAGTRSLNAAFVDVLGVADAFEGISMAGKTDIQIIKEGLEKTGFDREGRLLSELTEAYIRILRMEIVSSAKKRKPGVGILLSRLKDAKYPLGLLTGNIEDGARIKLRSLDLESYFATGAFGSDHEDRNQLLPIAVRRFNSLGIDVRPEDCIVIGDTPRDIECARVHGARCIAVATGPYGMESLAEHSPDLLVEDLTCISEFLSFLS